MLYVRHVKRRIAPRYPAKEAALANPELLEKLPQRWSACRQAVAAAGLLAAIGTTASGCDALSPFIKPTPEPLAGVAAIPQYVSETSALDIIGKAVKADLADAVQLVDPSSIKKPVVYVTCDGTQYQKVKWPDEPIDLYDATAGVGIEYQETTDSCLIYANETVSKPEKGNAYVLVMKEFSSDTAAASIQKQIQSFLEWLKAEGIV